MADVPDVLDGGEVPVVVDPEMEAIDELAPSAVVDAIVAKCNTGTRLESAEFVAALGPGFEAGIDCHAVIENEPRPKPGACDLGRNGRIRYGHAGRDFDAV